MRLHKNSISRRLFLKQTLYTVAFLSSFTKPLSAFAHQSLIQISDFGNLVKKKISGFINSAETYQQFKKNGYDIHPRGTAHSCMGQSLKNNAFVFSAETFDMKFDGENVTASASTTLYEIDQFLESYDYMLPVSPDYRVMSLGGVLGVGGFDISSSFMRGLVDHVISMTIITPEGKLKKDVPANDIEAQKMLCGLGEHGAILSAKIKCIKKPKQTAFKRNYFQEPSDYIEFLQKALKDSDANNYGLLACAGWSNQRPWIDLGHYSYSDQIENGFLENPEVIPDIRLYKKSRVDTWVYKNPYKYYVWSDHFVPLEKAESQISRGLKLKDKITEMGAEAAMYSYLVKANKHVEHFPHYHVESPYLISVGVYSNFTADQKEIAEKVSEMQLSYSRESQQEENAKPYKYGWYSKD